MPPTLWLVLLTGYSDGLNVWPLASMWEIGSLAETRSEACWGPRNVVLISLPRQFVSSILQRHSER